jgi:hypothetical protein
MALEVFSEPAEVAHILLFDGEAIIFELDQLLNFAMEG